MSASPKQLGTLLSPYRQYLTCIGVFLLSLAFYWFISHTAALNTNVNRANFDCIFSTDSSLRIALILKTGQHDPYTASFHPLFIPLCRTFYKIFLGILGDPAAAILAIQLLFASTAVLLFYLTLCHFKLPAGVRFGATTLYTVSFSNMLYATYFDAMAPSAMCSTLAIYLIVRYPQLIKNLIGTGVLLTIAAGGLAVGLIQHYAFLVSIGFGGFSFTGTALIARNATAAILIAILLVFGAQRIVGHRINFSDYTTVHEFEGNVPRHYGYLNGYNISKGNPTNVRNLFMYFTWVAYNFFDLDTQRDVFLGVLINPVVNFPITTFNPFWSHSCTWFDYHNRKPQINLGIPLLICLVAGMRACLLSRDRVKIGLALAFFGYFMFFGFGYTTLISYLYGTQFLSTYLMLVAIGAASILESARRIWPKSRISLMLSAMLCIALYVAIVNNLRHWHSLIKLTIHYFG